MCFKITFVLNTNVNEPQKPAEMLERWVVFTETVGPPPLQAISL